MTRRLLRVAAATAALSSGLASAATSQDRSPESLAGTYELVICRGACDPRRPESVRASGTLVLEPASFPLATLPEPGRSYILQHRRRLLIRGAAVADPNACFVLRGASRDRSLVGSTPVGFTTWSLDPGAGRIRIKIAQSAETSYVLSLLPEGGRLAGRGREPAAAQDAPADSVWARRLGPPDRAVCVQMSDRLALAEARSDSVARSLEALGRAALPTAAAGTYAVEICPEACDPHRRSGAVRGILVIEDTAFQLSDLTDPARRYARYASGILLWVNGRPNACFILDRPLAARSYAGLGRVGFTRVAVAVSGSQLGGQLLLEPSAEYTVRFAIRDGRLEGRGFSLVRNPFDGVIPPDSLVGRRIGPPDRRRCIQSAEQAAASLPPGGTQ